MNQKNDTWEEVIYEKYSDKEDERYGRSKSNNTVLQNLIDDFKSVLHERESAATQRAIDIADGMNKRDIVGIKNGEYISIRDAEIGAYNSALSNFITRLREGV